jgi:hypothetical protein
MGIDLEKMMEQLLIQAIMEYSERAGIEEERQLFPIPPLI